MTPADLRARYGVLVARWRERWPGEEPPPYPDPSSSPQEVVNTLQRIRARLTGEVPTIVSTSAEPFVIEMAPGEKPRGT